MRRVTLALLFAVFLGLNGWAQVPPGQTPPQQAPAPEPRPADRVEQTPISATATETTKFPLDRFQDFSAISNGGPLPGMDVDRYIYRSGKLMRVQGDASVPNYFVTDLEKQQSHALAASGCLRMTAHVRTFPFFVSVPGATYEIVAVGEETVDGHQCHVEDVKVHSPKNPVDLNFRLYEAEDLQGFPIKIENRRPHAHPWVIHYKDVRLGPQDPTLFVVPHECQSSAGFQKSSGTKPTPKTTPPAKPQ